MGKYVVGICRLFHVLSSNGHSKKDNTVKSTCTSKGYVVCRLHYAILAKVAAAPLFELIKLLFSVDHLHSLCDSD